MLIVDAPLETYKTVITHGTYVFHVNSYDYVSQMKISGIQSINYNFFHY